ncbi:MAG: acyl-CoA dehydrogenase family protein [Proteobacteria bacterium]|nr:acyl-CoA dehydrogenase family protein [Pseudomonadota bacterium]
MQTSTRPLAASDPIHRELVSRARSLVPRLRERALEVERTRRIHPDTLKELREAELWSALQPREFGGCELDLSVLLDLGYELGRGCTSTAWVYENNSMHSLLAGLFPRRAQEDLWGDGQTHRTLATGWPYKHASAVPVDGGFRLEGHWEFASGCHSSEGTIVRAPVVSASPDGKPDFRLFMLFEWLGEYEIVDVWRTGGLQGTGSDDLVVQDLFVPEHRVLAMRDINRSRDTVELQGAGVHASVWYRVPLNIWFPQTVPPALVGAAQGGLEHTLERNRTRRTQFGDRLAETQAMQLRLAEASVRIDSARLLQANALARIGELYERWEAPSLEERAAWRRDCAHAAPQAGEAATVLFQRGGAHGVNEDDLLQRVWRDIGVGAAHIATDWDAAGVICGQALQGLPVTNPTF